MTPLQAKAYRAPGIFVLDQDSRVQLAVRLTDARRWVWHAWAPGRADDQHRQAVFEAIRGVGDEIELLDADCVRLVAGDGEDVARPGAHALAYLTAEEIAGLARST